MVFAVVAGVAGAAPSAVSFTATPPLSSPQGPQAFAWSATGPTSCSLDGAAFSPCSSPRTYNSLALGDHSLTVALTSDLRGIAIQYIWTITPVGVLDVLFTGNAAGSAASSSRDATFAWLSDQVGATFQCSLDTGAFAACSAPRTYHSLAVGPHAFAVRATNTLGDLSVPATYSWTIVAPSPAPPVTCAGLLVGLTTPGDVVVPPGATCFLMNDGHASPVVGGNVSVGAGSSLWMFGVRVVGEVVSVGSSSIQITSGGLGGQALGVVGGSIRIRGLSNSSGFSPIYIHGVRVGGNIEIDNSTISNGIAFIGEDIENYVGGNVRIDNNSFGLRLTNNTVAGHVRVTGNASGVGALSVSGNAVDDNMEVSRNGYLPWFVGNAITGALSCVGNSVPPGTGGSSAGTTAGSYLPGQCGP